MMITTKNDLIDQLSAVLGDCMTREKANILAQLVRHLETTRQDIGLSELLTTDLLTERILDTKDTLNKNNFTKQGSEDVKQGSEDVKQGSEDVKQGSEDVKQMSEDVKQGSEDAKRKVSSPSCFHLNTNTPIPIGTVIQIRSKRAKIASFDTIGKTYELKVETGVGSEEYVKVPGAYKREKTWILNK